MPVASARLYRERQSNQSPRAPGQRARGEGCSFFLTSHNSASLKWGNSTGLWPQDGSGGGMAWGVARHRGNSTFFSGTGKRHAIHSFMHCANPHSQPFLRSFCRSTEPITSFRYRLFADETKPELPLREAPGSLSIDLNLDHEPRELLSSARSHETSLPSLPTSLTVNCELLTTDLQRRFSAPLDQRSPQSPRPTAGWVERGSRGSQCPSWSLFR